MSEGEARDAVVDALATQAVGEAPGSEAALLLQHLCKRYGGVGGELGLHAAPEPR